MRFSKNKRQLLKSIHGFSFIEVLVSMGLFSVGLLSIVALQLQSREVIANSSFKNQALAYASSEHEIHYLEKHYAGSATPLTKSWKKVISNVLPDIIIENKITENNVFFVLLWWPTNQKNAGCKVSNSQNVDCVQI